MCDHLKAPEIQQMYSLNMPVSAIRTKMRQEFERHRYVAQLKTVDVLLFNSHSEFQVRGIAYLDIRGGVIAYTNFREQETLNFWKQLTHVLKYFRAEEDPKAKLPQNFIQGFIEVGLMSSCFAPNASLI
jgi:NADH dehydrogenase (ubiquinone) 1 alpha subcomplex subunit 6